MTPSTRFAVALAAALLGVALAGCENFQAGLCPGDQNCMCTMGGGCSAVRNQTRFGGCTGSCRQVEHGDCPGGTNCLNNVGACGGGGGCLGPAGDPCACTGQPSDGNYFLTSFDGSSCSCGPCYSQGDYFTADRQRFGCGAHLNVCRGSTCVKAVVIDYGPSCFVEDDAGGPVLDSSPAVCKALTGGSSGGWSDHFGVHVSTALAPEVDGRPVGPFTVTEDEFEALVAIGRRLDRERAAAAAAAAARPEA